MSEIKPTKYLALTIGPIVKTLMEARKTRELWAASYLLSTLMKHLMKALDDPKVEVEKTGEDGQEIEIMFHPNILIPSIPKEVQKATLYGAGIYPDLLLMKAEYMEEKDVKNAISTAIEKLAKDCLLEEEQKDNETLKNAVDFWKQYLRIPFVLKDLDNIKNGDLSLKLTPYLANADLEDTFLTKEPELHALYHLFDIDRIYKVPLSEALKSKKNRGIYDGILKSDSANVPSTYEVASMELHHHGSEELLNISSSIEKDDPSEEFYAKLEKNDKLKKHLLPRHKYFCIVRADGDSIGAAIKQLKNEQNYIDFSEKLAVFGKDAAKKIDTFGGKPIYIGGDDLLFLAPVQNGEKTVFDLIDDLDDVFPKEDLHPNSSLSYGLNIVYYKYPLFEAINDSFGIMGKAKKYVNQKKQEKNAVSFHFIKHSGSYFEATFSKEFLAKINEVTKVFNEADPEGRKGLVSSLIFKIKNLETLLLSIFELEERKQAADQNYTSQIKDRLASFFEKYFEEWKDDAGFREQKEKARELLLAAYHEVGKDKCLDLYFSTMRLIDFINEPNQLNINDTQN